MQILFRPKTTFGKFFSKLNKGIDLNPFLSWKYAISLLRDIFCFGNFEFLVQLSCKLFASFPKKYEKNWLTNQARLTDGENRFLENKKCHTIGIYHTFTIKKDSDRSICPVSKKTCRKFFLRIQNWQQELHSNWSWWTESAQELFEFSKIAF